MKKKHTRAFRGGASIVFILACLASLVYSLIPVRHTLAEGTAEIHFVDVGQADAAFVVTSEGTVLIDAGTAESAPTLYHTLKKYGNTLSCMIITHPHDDHMGGASYILKKMNVHSVILPADTVEGSLYESFLDAVYAEGADVHSAEVDMSFTLGGAEFTFLAPYTDTKDENENSAVIRMQYGDISALFTGDAGAQSERLQMARYGTNPGGALDADILKVGHHGSGGSSLIEYLYAVSPRYAVISCGVKNSYGHPDPLALERLEEADAAVYRTDTDGTVSFVLDGEKITRKK